MIPWMGAKPLDGQAAAVEQSVFDFGMTDLEEQMRGAAGAERRAAIVARFVALEQAIAAHMAAGVSPEDFNRNRIYREALAHARKIVIAFR